MTSWLVVAIVALVVVGPKKMPSAVRKAARTMGRIRRAADEFKRQLLTMEDEPRAVDGAAAKGGPDAIRDDVV